VPLRLRPVLPRARPTDEDVLKKLVERAIGMAPF
jgi:hypothetical protein